MERLKPKVQEVVRRSVLKHSNRTVSILPHADFGIVFVKVTNFGNRTFLAFCCRTQMRKLWTTSRPQDSRFH